MIRNIDLIEIKIIGGNTMSKKISIFHQLDVIHKELLKMNEETINEIVEMLKGINFEDGATTKSRNEQVGGHRE